MEYGYVISNDSKQTKIGVLRFSNGRKVFLDLEELDEFEVYIKFRIKEGASNDNT